MQRKIRESEGLQVGFGVEVAMGMVGGGSGLRRVAVAVDGVAVRWVGWLWWGKVGCGGRERKRKSGPQFLRFSWGFSSSSRF